MRLARVQQAVREFSCMDWYVALLAAFFFVGVTAIAVWLGEEIDDFHGVWVRAASWFGLAGVPLVMVIYVIKVRVQTCCGLHRMRRPHLQYPSDAHFLGAFMGLILNRVPIPRCPVLACSTVKKTSVNAVCCTSFHGR